MINLICRKGIKHPQRVVDHILGGECKHKNRRKFYGDTQCLDCKLHFSKSPACMLEDFYGTE